MSGRTLNAPARAARRDSTFELLSDGADSQLNTAAKLNLLCLWIESARCLTDAVSYVAGHDEVFAARLRKADIRWNAAQWDDQLSDGLVALQYLIGQQLDEARQAVQAAMTSGHRSEPQ